MAGARCRWRTEGPDRNAVLYDSDGQVVSEHVLGDGIGHVLATSAGQVWVGYFDEGIYGNYGRGRLTARSRSARTGSSVSLPIWSRTGTTRNTPKSGRGTRSATVMPSMSMTRAPGACYYSDFPVVRIRDGGVTGWHNDIKGASALAVAGSRVALFGGYGPDYDRLALAELGADRAQPAGEYRVVLPAGSRSRQAPRSSAAEADCISLPAPAGTSSA